MKGVFDWSQVYEQPKQIEDSNYPLTPKMDQMLKVQQQKYY